jgi:hypothetical protein
MSSSTSPPPPPPSTAPNAEPTPETRAPVLSESTPALTINAPPSRPAASELPPRLSFSTFAHPIHPLASSSAPVLTPPAETDRDKSAWLDIDTAPASARTSFSRVDATRVGTPDPDMHVTSPPSPVPESMEGSISPSSDPAPTSVPVTAAVPAQEPVSVSAPAQEQAVPQAPQATLTFLTVSGLRKTMSFDPDTAVSRVKELMWSSWPTGS